MAGFKSAFAAARKAGKSTFTWNGKSYNTKMAKEGKSKKSSFPTKTDIIPTARPNKEASGPFKARPNASAGMPGFTGKTKKKASSVSMPSKADRDIIKSKAYMTNMSAEKKNTFGKMKRGMVY